jgi:tetratricopeptide (TPR) repeat protein
MVDKINRLKSWQVALIILIIGFAVFFTGLKNPFEGDDTLQIVNNPVIHSLSHVRLFFEGGTFYDGAGIKPLIGSYYRPLATTLFSLLYTLFGLHPFYFHLVQILLCIISAYILYLIFRYSFKPVLAIFLSLVFLVHPIDSQVAFAIPNMQDALFFFFGILAIYLLMRLSSYKSLILVALCLFLSLLSKETGVLFVAMALLYLFWWNRARLLAFVGITVVPFTLWLLLKIHAVGLDSPSINGPVDKLGLGGRLLTAPSIGLFYMSKFIFPLRLASAYYWVHPTYSIRYVLIPLIIDLAVIAVAIYGAYKIHEKASKAQYYTYLFFIIWCVLGVVINLQIIPLDFTASEPWIYFAMPGALGAIGVIINTFISSIYIDRRIILILAGILLIVFGVRTAFRGTDWRSSYVLAKRDIAALPDDYTAYNDLAIYYFGAGNYSEAKLNAVKSVDIYPNATNEAALGGILSSLGDYSGAYTALTNGTKYLNYYVLYDDLAILTLYHGNPNNNYQFFANALKIFPHDPVLWQYLAILEDRYGYNAEARVAITKAVDYGGQVPENVYSGIISNKQFIVPLGNTGKSLTIQ